MVLRILMIIVLFYFTGCVKKSNPTPQLASPQAFVIPSDSLAEVFK
jgi:hypothetical protein